MTQPDPAAYLPTLDSGASAPDHGWRVVGAAVRGISHERTGLPCQDAQRYRVLADGTLLVAVADGAGSARYSDQGARKAVTRMLRFLDKALSAAVPASVEDWQRLMRRAFHSARKAVFRVAEATSEAGPDSARDYACTLTCAVSSGDWLVVGQVGDGAVVAALPDGGLFTVTRLQRGEYANETHFLIQADALDQLVIDVYDTRVSALAVMSDGLIRLALRMPSQDPHVPFFKPLLNFVESTTDAAGAARQLSAFLASERVNARTDDDKSLVLAVRVPAADDAWIQPEAVEEFTAVPEAEDQKDPSDRNDE
jgi:hypothetical protein